MNCDQATEETAEGPHGYSQSRNRRGGAAAGDTHLVSLWRWKRIGEPLVRWRRRLANQRHLTQACQSTFAQSRGSRVICLLSVSWITLYIIRVISSETPCFGPGPERTHGRCTHVFSRMQQYLAPGLHQQARKGDPTHTRLSAQ